MTDITPLVNEALKKQGALLIVSRRAKKKNVDEFLKEAYRIVAKAKPDVLMGLADV